LLEMSVLAEALEEQEAHAIHHAQVCLDYHADITILELMTVTALAKELLNLQHHVHVLIRIWDHITIQHSAALQDQQMLVQLEELLLDHVVQT